MVTATLVSPSTLPTPAACAQIGRLFLAGDMATWYAAYVRLRGPHHADAALREEIGTCATRRRASCEHHRHSAGCPLAPRHFRPLDRPRSGRGGCRHLHPGPAEVIMGYFYLVIAAVTLYCIIGAETQHRWGPWVDRITSSSRKG